MASDLYETLNVPRDASSEQIRKAYKKMALQTHPDRLPPNATQADKAASEEQFRKVNNAYEVLNNEANRKTYDRYGVWPPPEPEYDSAARRAGPSRHHTHHHTHHHHGPPMGSFHGFDDPFFRQPFPSFVFTDPFVLFESVFGDHHQFEAPRHTNPYEPRSHRYEPDNPFERVHQIHTNMISNFMSDMNNDMFAMFNGVHGRPRFSPTSDGPGGSGSGNGRWASESHMVSTVNGITQSIHERRDWDGNTHITRTLPDGQEVYTINGVEQPPASLGYYRNERAQLPAPPQVGQIHSTGGSHYPQNNALPYPTHDHHRHHSRHHSRRYSESRPVIPQYAEHQVPEGYDPTDADPQHRKRWWRGGW
ncbi:hypothetical protein ONZ45_g6888 [Pleurotus djamor]|nr:hypothetical protein ONZ45_g6888 [Pleurotus djamor]